MAAFVETGLYLRFDSLQGGKKCPVLWPVLVHRVLYPEARRPQLNLFQRAVLGLIRARTVQVEAIAELTGLHQNLIKLILAQGVSNGWLLEDAQSLTAKGERLLDDEERDDAQLKSGYLLQDALTGQFWPRLVPQLNLLEPQDPLARFPEFLVDRKTGQTIRPYMITSGKLDLQPLDHESLTLAYRDYREDYRASQQLGHGSQQSKQISLHGVQRLDDAPQSARVLVWLTADDHGSDLWSAKDPFELREKSWWLQDTLLQAIEGDARLLVRLEPLVGVPRADNQTFEQWRDALHKQTELQVLMAFPWVERQPDIKRHLVALLVRQEKLQQGDSRDQELDAAMMECQKLLEVVMQWLIRKYPADVGQLPKQQRFDPTHNQQILSALQLPAFTEDVIRLLSRQKIDQVIRACSKPSDSLKALLFAAAMGTLKAPQHPLKLLGDRELQLDKLMELANLRNQSSHAQSRFTGRETTQLTSRVALDSIQYALGFTAYFKEWM
ncbi:hypothetical protein ACG97_11945 [Vogesella sp. EB]|uniref:hypothetical protein n=1 Tax=Vogesella sp. EB TaxID=1526735 RepID=UPI00064D5914|nr:hypothetical protein [Vogesella sp. EB]KMJ52773.1 hypothetical protein ACG97_11945 [Vogesella sp. EB]